MNIALIGYGKMGRILEETALERGHHITAIIDPFVPLERSARGAVILKSIADLKSGSVAAAIDFTRPDSALPTIKAMAQLKVPLVIGTTGWYDSLSEAVEAVERAGSSLLYASNFSLGVNLFYKVAACAAKLFDPFGEYDVAGYEMHHNKKADSPSGTAKTLVEKVLSQMTRKSTPVYDALNRAPKPEELHFSSLRLGSVPGVHSLLFDSGADTIEITHSARSREGFASGAIVAAQWLAGNGRRQGVFTFDHVLDIF
ncbi:4-hydroxy-tetrahydrodipicolinate reductase [Breznakiellaceae bacterium SP9]